MFHSENTDFLLQLHNLFWLTDFLLPKCHHAYIIPKAENKATSFAIKSESQTGISRCFYLSIEPIY